MVCWHPVKNITELYMIWADTSYGFYQSFFVCLYWFEYIITVTGKGPLPKVVIWESVVSTWDVLARDWSLSDPQEKQRYAFKDHLPALPLAFLSTSLSFFAVKSVDDWMLDQVFGLQFYCWGFFWNCQSPLNLIWVLLYYKYRSNKTKYLLLTPLI